ncbi:MAG: serine/threonine-protein kinase, partial [Myxococcota bacterium]
QALEQAHAAGVVHRDIKSSNVMVIDRDGQRAVKLLDFGIAKLLDNSDNSAVQTSVGMILGSMHSLAPEQIRAEVVDARADVYSLGVLLFHMLTAKLPFRGPNEIALAQMHLGAPPPRPSSRAPVSAAIDRVVIRAMAKKRESRFQSALELLDAFRRAVEQDGQIASADHEALAVYVEGRVDLGTSIDDAVLLDLLGVVDIALFELRAAGMQILWHTNQAVLAALPLPHRHERATDAAEQRCTELIDAAHHMHRLLEDRDDADARVHVNICLHRDVAEFAAMAGDSSGDSGERRRPAEIVDGAITEVARWAPERNLDGVWGTARLMGWAEDEATAGHIRLGESSRSQ